jgi:hypothetical protein
VSAPYWDIRAKVQTAIAAYLLATDAGARLVASDDWAGSPTLVPVRVGFTSDLIEAMPMVAVVAAQSSRYLPEVVSQSDNTRLVTLRVMIRSSTDEVSGSGGDTPAEDFHNELVAAIFDMLNDEGIVAAVNAVAPADCTVQQIDLTDEGSQIVDNNLETWHEMQIVAMPQ